MSSADLAPADKLRRPAIPQPACSSPCQSGEWQTHGRLRRRPRRRRASSRAALHLTMIGFLYTPRSSASRAEIERGVKAPSLNSESNPQNYAAPGRRRPRRRHGSGRTSRRARRATGRRARRGGRRGGDGARLVEPLLGEADAVARAVEDGVVAAEEGGAEHPRRRLWVGVRHEGGGAAHAARRPHAQHVLRRPERPVAAAGAEGERRQLLDARAVGGDAEREQQRLDVGDGAGDERRARVEHASPAPAHDGCATARRPPPPRAPRRARAQYRDVQLRQRARRGARAPKPPRCARRRRCPGAGSRAAQRRRRRRHSARAARRARSRAAQRGPRATAEAEDAVSAGRTPSRGAAGTVQHAGSCTPAARAGRSASTRRPTSGRPPRWGGRRRAAPEGGRSRCGLDSVAAQTQRRSGWSRAPSTSAASMAASSAQALQFSPASQLAPGGVEQQRGFAAADVDGCEN